MTVNTNTLTVANNQQISDVVGGVSQGYNVSTAGNGTLLLPGNNVAFGGNLTVTAGTTTLLGTQNSTRGLRLRQRRHAQHRIEPMPWAARSCI